MCRKKIFSTGFWRILWKDFFPQPIHPHSTAPVDKRAVPADNAHGSFLLIVTSLPRPVSAGSARSQFRTPGCPRWQFRTVAFSESLLPYPARYRSMCDAGFSLSSIRQRGNEAPREEQTKTGAKAETHHPSQSEGSIFRWLGGILKGKTPNGSELFSP